MSLILSWSVYVGFPKFHSVGDQLVSLRLTDIFCNLPQQVSSVLSLYPQMSFSSLRSSSWVKMLHRLRSLWNCVLGTIHL